MIRICQTMNISNDQYDDLVKSLNLKFYDIELIDALPLCGICSKWQHDHIIIKISNVEQLLNNLNRLVESDLTSSKIDVYTNYFNKLTELKYKYEID